MKKVFCLSLMLLSFFYANAQADNSGFQVKKEAIEIGSVSSFFQEFATLRYYEEYGDFVFFLRNTTYRAIVDVYIVKIDTSEILEFYNVILDNLGKDVVLERKTGDSKTISLVFKNNRVNINVWNGVSWSYSLAFSKRQILLLFSDFEKHLIVAK